jgi:hypothetical protein
MPDIFINPPEEKEEPGTRSTPKPELKHAKHDFPGHTHNPLAAYSYYPDQVNFENREKEENVVLLLRRHPITNVGWLLAAAMMLIAPLVLLHFPILSFLPTRFQFVAVLGWYLVSFAFVLQKFAVWFYDIFIITNERVLDIDFYNLIYKEVTDASLDKIQDVTYSVGGVASAVFNYGEVTIQTAGEIENLQFEAVPWPDKVAKILQDVRMDKNGGGT